MIIQRIEAVLTDHLPDLLHIFIAPLGIADQSGSQRQPTEWLPCSTQCFTLVPEGAIGGVGIENVKISTHRVCRRHISGHFMMGLG